MTHVRIGKSSSDQSGERRKRGVRLNKPTVRALAFFIICAFFMSFCSCSIVPVPAPSLSASPSDYAPTPPGHIPASAPPASGSAVPSTTQPHREGIPFSALDIADYDPAALDGLLSRLNALLAEPDRTEQVLELYYAITNEVALYYDAYTIAQLEYYLEPENSEKEAVYSKYEYMDTKFEDDVSLAISAILNSEYGDELAAVINNDKLLVLKDYKGLDDTLKALYDKETELELLYDSYYTDLDYLTVDIDGVTWSWFYFWDNYQNYEYDIYIKAYEALQINENEKLGGTLVELVRVRNEIAAYCGYDNYYEMVWSSNYLRDYTFEDYLTIREYTLKNLMPAYDMLSDRYYPGYYSGDGTDWDMSDFFSELSENPMLTGNMREALSYLSEYDLLLLGGESAYDASYQTKLYTLNQPFVYHKQYDAMYDATSLSHETGHAVNGYLSSLNAIEDNYASIDVCEIHSNGFELLAMDAVAAMYPEKFDVIKRMMLLDVLMCLVDVSLQVDIEHMLYTTDDLTLDKANRLTADIMLDYGMPTEFEDVYYYWSEIPHYSFSAGYVISYVTSAAAALALWLESAQDKNAAMAKFDDLLSADASWSFMEAVQAYELTEIFTEEFYTELSAYIRDVFFAS